MSEIIERPIDELKQHDLNAQIYGTGVDEGFLENIREFGVQTPITVCKSFDPNLNDVIVKGRRRAFAAALAGKESVPTIEWLCDDPDEVQKQLILDNVRNEVTVEQRARMFIELRRIEAKKIKEEVGIGDGFHSKSEEKRVMAMRGENPSAAAAASSGLSQKTAERARHAVLVADKLKEEGREEESQEILDTLNNKSVFAASKKASDAIATEKSAEPAPSASDDVDRHLAKATNSVKSLEESLGPLIRAVDSRLAEDKGFAGHHRLLITKLRLLHDELDKVKATHDVFKEMWSNAKRG